MKEGVFYTSSVCLYMDIIFPKKLQEFSDENFICGIYCIVNSITGKIYIGSSKNILQRIKNHIKDFKSKKHRNMHLQNSFNMYGMESFFFCCLEKCDIDMLLSKEQDWMNITKCYDKKFGYNIIPRADRKNFSKEHRIRLSESHMGHKHTQESIEKIRYHSLIRKYPSFSKPVLQFDNLGNLLNEYASILEAGKLNNYCKENIAGCCMKRNNQKKAYGYIWVLKSNCVDNNLTKEELEWRNSGRLDRGSSRVAKKGIKVTKINADGSTVVYCSVSEAMKKENIDRYSFSKSIEKIGNDIILYEKTRYYKKIYKRTK